MRQPSKSAYEQITDASEFKRGGHQTCTLESVILGTGRVEPARALWRIQNGPIPLTHTLRRTCDLHGCIEPDHHTLEPLKREKQPSRRTVEAWEQNRQLRAQVASLESERVDMQATIRTLSARLAELEGTANGER